MSPQLTSNIDPTEMKELKPTLAEMLHSKIAVPKAPDWLKKATDPGRAMWVAKLAFNPMCGLMSPRQFGPTIRKPVPLIRCRIWRSNFDSAPRSHGGIQVWLLRRNVPPSCG